MLSQSRPLGLQHRHTTTKACWLWGDRQQQQQQQQASAPAQPAPIRTNATSSLQSQKSTVVVQAAAEQQQPAQVELVVPVESQPVVPVSPAAPLKPINRSFYDVMKFNGPGPELINGRLAMLAFLAVPKNEIETGATVLQQATSASPWVYGLLLLVVYASMVPLLKGARHEAFGFFTPQAELTNGRAAMLGFGILLALEYNAGVPFF